ncbi:hypothetical protein [Thioclava pacifica]|uniref:DUF306 domain-containing protein n=1 Tax=Thioclava pacifica DSM 10166 TaxID=1353537 RepID=A0A074J3T9_9RHOB|nr:hypothetical protein [Thioclava pacifica]KEO51159.1 hypothetical protein TP2_12245 [Thioclava pacifica DSM 10166]
MTSLSSPLRRPIAALVLGLFAAACTPTGPATSETLAARIDTLRAYDLVSVDGAGPARALRFYIGDNSRFAICGHCLCGTGIMVFPYPKLGIRPTSASPTLSCDWDSQPFKADGELVGMFFDMTEAQVDGAQVTFSGSGDHVMVFTRGGTDLSPP